jgi:ABC-2 type transport system permease protein
VTTAVAQVGYVAGRSLARTFRQPAMIIPNITFPLLVLAINSNGLRAATHLPGFPTTSFLDFFIPVCFLQGALFAAIVSGLDLGRDIDSGFLNRLALTPVRGTGLLLGELGGAAGLGAIQAVTYLIVGLSFGVRFETGVAGALVLLVLAILIGIGFGTLGLFLALRTGSGEAVQSSFPLLFFLLFISSMNLPRNLIEISWFRDLATINPVSYMIEAMRSLVISGWDGQALALGFLATGCLITGGLIASGFALRSRMTRT